MVLQSEEGLIQQQARFIAFQQETIKRLQETIEQQSNQLDKYKKLCSRATARSSKQTKKEGMDPDRIHLATWHYHHQKSSKESIRVVAGTYQVSSTTLQRHHKKYLQSAQYRELCDEIKRQKDKKVAKQEAKEEPTQVSTQEPIQEAKQEDPMEEDTDNSMCYAINTLQIGK
ncbi:hypothetical protein BJV82DRAFT_584486 [Fennellomyces sp. T-0311]|nr:hypothetical protein BJV82DRAFT_584567 [Fennellomyces sp. T-0311]KAI8136505.1 hypothetical protein BJV82DRAFT_584486 [Fennellomyces sp. T-0311]